MSGLFAPPTVLEVVNLSSGPGPLPSARGGLSVRLLGCLTCPRQPGSFSLAKGEAQLRKQEERRKHMAINEADLERLEELVPKLMLLADWIDVKTGSIEDEVQQDLRWLSEQLPLLLSEMFEED